MSELGAFINKIGWYAGISNSDYASNERYKTASTVNAETEIEPEGVAQEMPDSFRPDGWMCFQYMGPLSEYIYRAQNKTSAFFWYLKLFYTQNPVLNWTKTNE